MRGTDHRARAPRGPACHSPLTGLEERKGKGATAKLACVWGGELSWGPRGGGRPHVARDAAASRTRTRTARLRALKADRCEGGNVSLRRRPSGVGPAGRGKLQRLFVGCQLLPAGCPYRVAESYPRFARAEPSRLWTGFRPGCGSAWPLRAGRNERGYWIGAVFLLTEYVNSALDWEFRLDWCRRKY